MSFAGIRNRYRSNLFAGITPPPPDDSCIFLVTEQVSLRDSRKIKLIILLSAVSPQEVSVVAKGLDDAAALYISYFTIRGRLMA